jgi:hypothetical protein
MIKKALEFSRASNFRKSFQLSFDRDLRKFQFRFCQSVPLPGWNVDLIVHDERMTRHQDRFIIISPDRFSCHFSGSKVD